MHTDIHNTEHPHSLLSSIPLPSLPFLPPPSLCPYLCFWVVDSGWLEDAEGEEGDLPWQLLLVHARHDPRGSVVTVHHHLKEPGGEGKGGVESHRVLAFSFSITTLPHPPPHNSLVSSRDLDWCEVAWVTGDELNEGPVHTLDVLLLHNAVQRLQPTTNGLDKAGRGERMGRKGGGEGKGEKDGEEGGKAVHTQHTQGQCQGRSQFTLVMVPRSAFSQRCSSSLVA